MKLGKRIIGEGGGVYIIAEMSGNHCGDINKAIEIIHAAKEAGADAIKLQTYTADTLTLNFAGEDFKIPSQNPWNAYNTLYSVYQKAFTPWEWHRTLFKTAHEIGIDIFSSPFDETAVDLLEELETPFYKIASPEITHIPLLKKVAQTGKPVLFSTGVARLEDIELAVSTLVKNGCQEFAILKCTSSYPAPPESINLTTMIDLKKRFNCVVGLSDHSLGIGIPIAAVVLGSNIIEKHFILEKDENAVDGFFSLDRKEFKEMVVEIRKVEKSIGKVSYDLDEEGKKNYWGRRSLYVSSEIKKGEIITSQNIKCVRPYHGLHPIFYEEVLGKVALRDLHFGDRLTLESVAK